MMRIFLKISSKVQIQLLIKMNFATDAQKFFQLKMVLQLSGNENLQCNLLKKEQQSSLKANIDTKFHSPVFLVPPALKERRILQRGLGMLQRGSGCCREDLDVLERTGDAVERTWMLQRGPRMLQRGPRCSRENLDALGRTWMLQRLLADFERTYELFVCLKPWKLCLYCSISGAEGVGICKHWGRQERSWKESWTPTQMCYCNSRSFIQPCVSLEFVFPPCTRMHKHLF